MFQKLRQIVSGSKCHVRGTIRTLILTAATVDKGIMKIVEIPCSFLATITSHFKRFVTLFSFLSLSMTHFLIQFHGTDGPACLDAQNVDFRISQIADLARRGSHNHGMVLIAMAEM